MQVETHRGPVAQGGAQGPNAESTIGGNSSFQNARPWEPARSVMTTSAPASRSASAHRLAMARRNLLCAADKVRARKQAGHRDWRSVAGAG